MKIKVINLGNGRTRREPDPNGIEPWTLGPWKSKPGRKVTENRKIRIDVRLPQEKIDWLRSMGGITETIERLIDAEMNK